MLAHYLPLFLSLLFGCIGAARAEGAPKIVADNLAKRLETEEVVYFYFVSSTGKYSFRGDRFKAEASIMVRRECGANCRQFMEKVLQHLEQSVPAVCERGQENVLIETGSGTTILYSHSGRAIEYDGQCFFNDSGIEATITSTEFLFE